MPSELKTDNKLTFQNTPLQFFNTCNTNYMYIPTRTTWNALVKEREEGKRGVGRMSGKESGRRRDYVRSGFGLPNYFLLHLP